MRTDITMEMKRLSGGNLRAAGYDDRNRLLVVELHAGTFQYSGVTPETWRRFIGASSPWSFFRDNIEEDYPAKRIR
jgi:hypothetical protein